MGQQVAHVEVVGKDAEALRGFYGEMFGWKFSEPMGPTDYTFSRTRRASVAALAPGQRAIRVTSCSTSKSLTWERRSRRRKSSAAPG
jgi:predicted enzyme related to lactoylglutathione lyase